MPPRPSRPSVRNNAYTLTELLAVVSVAGMMTTLGIGTYLKSVEVMKANVAQGTLRHVEVGNKLRRVDWGAFATGEIDNTSVLVADGYLTRQDWGGGSYLFYGADDPSSPCLVAKTVRRRARRGAAGRAPYGDWSFCLDIYSQALASDPTFGLPRRSRCGAVCNGTIPEPPPPPPQPPPPPHGAWMTAGMRLLLGIQTE